MKCIECNGTGMEICSNPDHGFISAMPGDVGRIGCPCCGSDELHRIPNTKCGVCGGTGVIDDNQSINRTQKDAPVI